LAFFKRLFTWWNGSTLGTLLQIRTKAVKVGEDEYGNHRYVIYSDYAEASKVPPVWNGWLHHTYDELPSEIDIKVHGWQESHIPNMTGTPFAYKPKGSLDRGGVRDAVAADYEAWIPGE
jgi:NADH:ubiquinone oxidoreductase subunit